MCSLKALVYDAPATSVTFVLCHGVIMAAQKLHL